MRKNSRMDNQLNQKIQELKQVKLHLGCGSKYFEGWINIDAKAEEFPGSDSNKVDVIFDLTNPLPIQDNSVDFIFHDNFFEHLTFEDGLNLLKDHYRVLKEGGVVRINQPDLEAVVNLYLNNGFEKIMIVNRTYREHYSKERWGYEINRNRCESINYCFRQLGQHKYLYDYDEMKLRLMEAGFKEENIKRCNNTISEFKQLQNLDALNTMALVVEAIK